MNEFVPVITEGTKMPICYFLGESVVPYDKDIRQPGWRIEKFEHSDTELKVTAKLKRAHLIFCDYDKACQFAEMMLQLHFAMALKKRICCIVEHTKIKDVPEYKYITNKFKIITLKEGSATQEIKEIFESIKREVRNCSPPVRFG